MPADRSSRADYQYKVTITQCRANTFFYSNISKTSTESNGLPRDISQISYSSLLFQTLCASFGG